MANPSILVIDDDENVTATIKTYFELFTNFGVSAFNSPRIALQQIEYLSFDLIISDFLMPEMNGIEFLLEARKLYPDVPVILLTGLADKSNAIRAINEVGIYYYMEKPWDNDKLELIVNNAIEKNQLAHQLAAELTQKKALADQLLQELHDKHEQNEAFITALAKAIEAKDQMTEEHVERVKEYSLIIGQHLGLTAERLEILQTAALLHDIGKIGIPEAILNKPGKLDSQEFDTIKQHPLIAHQICSSVKSFKDVLPIILQHHEKLDGSGYPFGLKADAILIESRILAVTDIFDALIKDRPYRQALSLPTAFNILRQEAYQQKLDAQIVETLITIISSSQISSDDAEQKVDG